MTKATYDKARGGLVLVPPAPGAQHLRDAEWKGWSASWKNYVRARPVGFKVLGARAQALRLSVKGETYRCQWTDHCQAQIAIECSGTSQTVARLPLLDLLLSNNR